MQKITKKLVTTSTWAASTALTPVDLPREGLITEVGIRAHITSDTTALQAEKQTDCLRRVIDAIRIEGDGGRTYLGLEAEQMSRILGLWNNYEFNCPMISHLDATGIPTALAEDILFVFHPGSNPKDPFDMSAVIPARALSSLQVRLTTTIAAILDDTNDLAAGTFYYYVHEVLGIPVPAGIMTPMGSSKRINIGTGVFSAYSLEEDVPVGAWLRRIFILPQDEGAGDALLRADDELTQVRLKMPKEQRSLIELEWQELKLNSARNAGVNCVPLQGTDTSVEAGYAVPDGFGIIDLRKYFHPIYGANLTRYQMGDVKLGMSATGGNAGDDIILYYDQLTPVESVYVGK